MTKQTVKPAIPKFKTEAQERAYWEAHDSTNHVDWTKAKKITYALKSYADYKAQILENQLSGLLLKINDNEVGKYCKY